MGVSRDGYGHGFAAVQSLGAAGCRDGRAARDTRAGYRSLAHAVRQKDVNDGVASDPAMLDALGRDAVGPQSQVEEGLGEGKHLNEVGVYGGGSAGERRVEIAQDVR